MIKIIYCQSTWREDFEDTKLCVERVSPHVDATVIAFDNTLTEEQIHWLMVNSDPYRLHPVRFKWEDDMPAMRNSYLEEAKRLGADWVCVSDPDELYSEDLVKNLRRLIEENDMLGFNLLPLHAVDQFENIEWLDNLDLLKEAPGGYRETDFWKPILIFKVYPDLHYEGVGVEKRVHETLKSSTPWKPKNLPKQFHYNHRKSALRIWRNAARNMYIGGGGDNVGEINPHWPTLRSLLRGLGVETWQEFEGFVEVGTEDPKFHKWLFEALQAPPTNWGTETRETAKWYFTFHKGQITPEIRERLETPPEMTPEIEAENLVTRVYFQVLGRHPDEEGRKHYVKALLEEKITPQQLVDILQQSSEFRQKAGLMEPSEMVPMQVPVDVKVRITEGLFLEALKKSGIYWDIIKPKMDVGGFILGALRRKDEFLKWFYTNKEDLTAQDMLEWVVENTPKPNSVALCIMGYGKVLPMILESIWNIGPYVDEIHIQGDDLTEDDIRVRQTGLPARGRESAPVQPLAAEEEIDRQKTLGWIIASINLHTVPWEEEFSDYKNKCIAPANTEWVLILDHDEIPTEEIAKNLREIIKKSDHGRRYNMVQFDVIDVETVKGEVVSERRSPSGKALLHWNVPEPYYGNPHIWLKPNYYPWKMIHAPYAYRHIKERDSILPNSVRNVFLGGGGDNTREQNPLWVELRALTKELNIDTWKEFHAYLKKGKIDPRVLDALKRLAEMPWKDTELQDPLRYYYFLHQDKSAAEEPERDLSSEHFNPAVDGEFFKLAQSVPGSPGTFSSQCPEHQWEGRYRLRPGDTFVEAGAFWGRYGLIASKRVGPGGRVILIEGDPRNTDMIERVIKHYSLSNVTLVKGIVWSKDEYTKMCVGDNPAASRRAHDGDLVNYPNSIVDVRAYTLDTLLPELGIQNVDLLACDVEGAEVEMVLGADRYLGEGKIRNVALAAYHQVGFPERIMDLLRKKGFVDLFYSYDLPQFGTVVYGRFQK